MANSIQLWGAQIKRPAPITLEGDWFSDSLNTLATLNEADLLDEGDQFTVEDFVQVKMPKEARAGWHLPFPSEDQYGNVTDETHLPAIDGVVLYMRSPRLYFDKPYVEGQTDRPSCVSRDGITGEGTPGGACHTCTMNQWGSAVRLGLRAEGNAKACSQRTDLYVLTPLSPFPILISAPPTSLKDTSRLPARRGRAVRSCLSQSCHAAGTRS